MSDASNSNVSETAEAAATFAASKSKKSDGLSPKNPEKIPRAISPPVSPMLNPVFDGVVSST